MKTRWVEFPSNGMGAHIHSSPGSSRFGEGSVFLQDPDETLVKNVSPSFWKYKNGSVIPMSAAEQTDVTSRHKNEILWSKTDDSHFDARVHELMKSHTCRVSLLHNRVDDLGLNVERVSLRMKNLQWIVAGGFIAGFLTAIGIIAEVFFGF